VIYRLIKNMALH